MRLSVSAVGKYGREPAKQYDEVLDLYVQGVNAALENHAGKEKPAKDGGAQFMAREENRSEELVNRFNDRAAFSELSDAGKQEIVDILLRLEKGQSVSLREVNAAELFVNAFSRRGELNETININNVQRDRLRKTVQDEIEKLGSAVEKNGKIVYNGAVRKGHRADIVIGLPAAGKSSVLVDPLSALYGSRVIDSDMVKEALPEFNNGLGATNVHEESKKINTQILENARAKGKNIVLPVVGSNADSVLEYIRSFKSNSPAYEVYLHLNELPMYKALGRMIARYIQTGRFLAPELVYGYKNKPTSVYEQITAQEGGLLSGYSRYSNDVSYGEKPIFKGGTEDFYSAFTGRYRENIEAGSGDLRDRRERLSVKNQSRDADYLSAVERGDMETAQGTEQQDIRYQDRLSDALYDIDLSEAATDTQLIRHHLATHHEAIGEVILS